METISKAQVWTGRVLSGLASLFLLLDGAMKVAKPAVVLEANRQLGFPEAALTGIGVLLLACTVLYLAPRTALLGGAVAIQLRAGTPTFNIVFPVLMGAVVWLGFWLREPRVRGMLPLS